MQDMKILWYLMRKRFKCLFKGHSEPYEIRTPRWPNNVKVTLCCARCHSTLSEELRG